MHTRRFFDLFDELTRKEIVLQNMNENRISRRDFEEDLDNHNRSKIHNNFQNNMNKLENKYVCAECRYPAVNESIFRELESPFREMPKCPKCGSTEIILERRYAFKWGWKIIRESGTDKKIQEIPGTFLQLSKVGEEQPKGSMRYEDLPMHVATELDEKSNAVNKILQESGILEKLSKLSVNLRYNITVYDSK